MLGLLEEVGQRVGVGGPAGLGPLGLGHAELVEEHHLQLLGRAEVDLLADDVVGVVAAACAPGRRSRTRAAEAVDVDRDAGLLHAGQRPISGQLDVAQQLGAAVLVDRVVERVGEVEDGRGPAASPSRASSASPSKSSVSWSASPVPGAAHGEVAQGEVGEVVGALVGLDEVGRERGVAREAGPAASRARPAPASGPWRRGSPWGGPGPPATPRGPLVLGLDVATSIHAAGPSGGRHGERDASPVPARQVPCTDTPTRPAVRPRRASRRLARAQPAPSTSKPASASGSSAWTGSRRAGRAARRGTRARRTARAPPVRSHGWRRGRRVHRQGQVADQLVEPAVAQHVAEVLAQRLALLAGDLVGTGDDAVEAVELVDPLRRVALADARARPAGCRRSRPRSPRARGSGAAGRRTCPRPRPGHAPARTDAAHRVEHGRRRR